MRKHLLPIIASLLVFTSCANYKLNYSLEEQRTWAQQQPADSLVLEETIYVIGDAGNTQSGETNPVLSFLQQKVAEDSNSTVIFAGDNIYEKGLPPKNTGALRDQAEYRLKAQMDVVKDHPGQIVFLPGNHDWGYGAEGVERQEDFVDDYLQRDYDVFVPENACSEPEVIELNDHLVLVVIDSEWYLHDWEKEPKINDGCEIKSRREFLLHFGEALKKNRRKNVIVAMHHPLYTYGPHGGHYTFRQHIFPLVDFRDGLWLPLPVVGSAVNFLRSTIGHRQDVSHPLYKEMQDEMTDLAKLNGNFVFVSGHEHSMQYIEEDDQYFIVSGSGSKSSPVGLGVGSKFAYGHPGFAQIDVYEDGVMWVQFWAVDADGKHGKVVFRKKIKEGLPQLEDPPARTFELYESGQDSIIVTLQEGERKSKFHRFWWGEHYRDVFNTPIKVPVLALDTFQGGVIPVKRGGGHQTNSLRLEKPNGQQYVMRSLKKDASRIVPYPFNRTFITDIFRDNFTAANPYAAFVLPYLIEPLGIYHTNPKLYYVPKQPLMGLYNDNFGDELYLLEERPDEDWRNLESFGNSKEITSTYNLVEEMVESQKHIVDQDAFLKARLLDLVIADWDRHFDQWRWASFEDEHRDLTIYRPIPRDRDQVFSNYDGVIPGLLRQTIPFLRQLKPFREEIKNIKWDTYHGRFSDNRFLNQMEWEDWQAAARHLQETMTDEVIERAIRTFPPGVYEEVGAKTIRIVKARRDNLMKSARKYYEMLAKEVHIVGSEKEELFEVHRMDAEQTRVRVFDLDKNDERDELLYDRTFLTAETQEILLYGLDDDDVFEVIGEVQKGIKVRLIGGLGEDLFIDRSKVAGLSRETKVYDNLQKNKLELGSEAEDKRTRRPEYNTYDFKARQYEHDYSMVLPFFGFNPDDGVFIGANVTALKYGFGKPDFAQRHTFSGGFAFATSAYDFGYTGEFADFIGKWDAVVDAKIQAPQYVSNFFGLGNGTTYDDDAVDRDFNRVRQQRYGLYPGLRRNFVGGASWSINLVAENVEIEENQERFIGSDAAGVRAEVFDHQFFAGLETKFSYHNVNNEWVPTRGLRFNSTFGWQANLTHTDRNFGYIEANFAVYQNFFRNDAVILATRVGTEHRMGEFDFFQSAFLGGETNHRGFRNERFAGRTSFYHNTDLRIKLFSAVNYYIPTTIGIFGGYDYGRVWLDEEETDVWHNSIGGGLWVSPFDAAVLSAGLFHSDDGNRVAVSIGFLF